MNDMTTSSFPCCINRLRLVHACLAECILGYFLWIVFVIFLERFAVHLCELCLTHDSHCLIHSVTDVTHPVCEAGMSWHVGPQTASMSAALLLWHTVCPFYPAAAEDIFSSRTEARPSTNNTRFSRAKPVVICVNYIVNVSPLSHSLPYTLSDTLLLAL